MNDTPDTLALVSLTTRLICLGITLQSIELLANGRELRDDGLLGWRELHGRLFGPQGKLRWLHAWPACHIILALRALAAAASLALPLDTAAAPWVLAVLVGTQAYCNHRFKMIHEGSDSMFLIGLVAMLAGTLAPAEPRLRAVALLFFAAQVLLAYFAAGLDKLRSPAWRDGSLPTRAMQHGAHRFEPLGDLLARRKALALTVAWSVILFEVLFPLSVMLPAPAFWVFAGAGILFHAGVAFCMGLHGFFWSFVAAYPTLYFVSQGSLRTFFPT